MKSSFGISSPPAVKFPEITFPTPHILLVTLNRPRSLNCVNTDGHYELEELFKWFDDEPQLRCAVLTGAGRAFCAGADLKEWDQRNEKRARGELDERPRLPPSGFGGVGRRRGKKPIIGAVNGMALGGGFEIASAMDMVIAARSAQFALPEVKRGVGALSGLLPRLHMMLGKQRALEMALTGRNLTAQEGERWGFVSAIVDDAAPEEDVIKRPVVQKALEYAECIANNSPDSVIVIRDAIMSVWYEGNVDTAHDEAHDKWAKKLDEGENIKEGVKAFVEKRAPRWVNSKF
ncbi:ClpP/crotonase [Rhizodiscina lignyota]|uniref:ClpP/crotonase n=1 Tax=Rhizodiscina lignyota TaxID=1504668 RepID=A0A9P4INA2_9PEZI|nr:ClpP/crotonase [Rhizodiscina lignyota]